MKISTLAALHVVKKDNFQCTQYWKFRQITSSFQWLSYTLRKFSRRRFQMRFIISKKKKKKKRVKIGNLLRVDFTWKISAPQLRLFTMIYKMLLCTQICDFWTMINEPWTLTAWFVAWASRSDRYILYKHATMYQNRTAIGSTLAALGFGSIRHIMVRLQQWNSWLITYVRWHTAGNERILTHSNCTFWNY